MATTIIKNFTNQRWYPSSNPINATVTSNFNGKCNFRYICDVYINGIKVYTSKLFPDPSTGYGFFQISRIIQDYIETKLVTEAPNFPIMIGAETTAPTSALTIYCKFGEEYDNSSLCDGTIIQYNSQVQSNTFYVFESAIDYEDFNTFDYTKYYMTTSSQKTKFLTKSPRVNDISFGDSYFLDFMTLNTITSSYKLRIKRYNKDGTSSTNDISPSISLPINKRYRLAVGPSDLNMYFTNNFNTLFINELVSYYTIELLYNSTVISEMFRFNVKKPSKYNSRFGFVGSMGGIEHFTFFHRNIKTYYIDRKIFERTTQRNINNDWSYEVGDRGTTTYKVNSIETHRVSTFCSQEHSKWLSEMWLSPNVWTYKRTELIPFIVYREDSTPTSRMLFRLDGEYDISVGQKVLSFVDYNINYSDFGGYFTVVNIEGNVLDLGLTYDVYNSSTKACGHIQLKEYWRTLPIVIADNNIELKERIDKPIEYSLNYMMAYTKNTLR